MIDVNIYMVLLYENPFVFTCCHAKLVTPLS
ncbi:hypothetical protein Gotur_019725 [Gossypium turneri]